MSDAEFLAPDALAAAAIDRRADRRHGQLRARQRRYERGAGVARLRRRLDHSAHRHPRAPPRAARNVHQRHGRGRGRAVHRSGRRRSQRNRPAGARHAFARLPAAGDGRGRAGPARAELRGDGRVGRLRRVHVRAGDRHAVRRHGLEQVRAGDRRRHEQPRDESGRQENVSAVRRRRRRRAR